MENVIGLVTALVSSFGFSLLFNQSRQHWLFAALGGALCWGTFLLVRHLLGGIFLATMFAGALTVLYSELMARVRKTPASHYLIVGLIPLVPGGSLYYCMSYAIQGELDKARMYGGEAAQYALGIAVGISLTWALMEMVKRILQLKKEKKA